MKLKPEDYLHHRKPYLMIDSIVDLKKDYISTSKIITDKEIFHSGHFPGAPVVPGAMMQEMCTQSAGVLIAKYYNPMEEFNTHDPFFNKYALGVLSKVSMAKYLGFSKPGDELLIKVKLADRLGEYFSFNSTVKCKERVICKINFNLVNVESKLLYS